MTHTHNANTHRTHTQTYIHTLLIKMYPHTNPYTYTPIIMSQIRTWRLHEPRMWHVAPKTNTGNIPTQTNLCMLVYCWVRILLVYLHISMRKNMSAPSNVCWMGNPTWTTKPNPPKKLKLATSTKYGITEKRQDTHKHHRWKNNLYIYSKTIRATVFMCGGKD